MFFIKKFWLILPFIFTSNGAEHPNGHLQPIGSQIPPIGDVLSVTDIPSPEEFFTQYIKPGKPVLFKGAATKMPAYKLWTDEYISSKYGDLIVDVEEGKKENRSKELFNMPLSKFIKTYNESDVYLVYSLPKIMRDEIYLLKCILCGGFTNALQDSVMWFSNGGTKSVLHFDAIDNINCLMSGTKDLFIVDKKDHAHIEIDKPDGSFSKVDVEKVDLYKYPGLRNVPWYRGKMEPGDCLFIPYRWFHHVRSFGPRNMAINIWFAHQLTFNSTDCDHSPYKGKDFAPLSDFIVLQNLQQNFKTILLDEMQEKPLDMRKWVEMWESFVGDSISEEAWRDLMKGIFSQMDTNKDLIVTTDEVVDASLSKEQEQFLEEILSMSDEDDNEDEEPDGDEDVDGSKEDELDETEEDDERPKHDVVSKDGDDDENEIKIPVDDDEIDSFGQEIKHDDL